MRRGAKDAGDKGRPIEWRRRRIVVREGDGEGVGEGEGEGDAEGAVGENRMDWIVDTPLVSASIYKGVVSDRMTSSDISAVLRAVNRSLLNTVVLL